jgi:hypothetical protein
MKICWLCELNKNSKNFLNIEHPLSYSMGGCIETYGRFCSKCNRVKMCYSDHFLTNITREIISLLRIENRSKKIVGLHDTDKILSEKHNQYFLYTKECGRSMLDLAMTKVGYSYLAYLSNETMIKTKEIEEMRVAILNKSKPSNIISNIVPLTDKSIFNKAVKKETDMYGFTNHILLIVEEGEEIFLYIRIFNKLEAKIKIGNIQDATNTLKNTILINNTVDRTHESKFFQLPIARSA